MSIKLIFNSLFSRKINIHKHNYHIILGVEMAGKRIGKITHFFPKINVAVIELEGILKNGDKILIEGHGTKFEQAVDSMQIDRVPVESAKKGQAIGLRVEQPVKEGDIVFLSS